MISGFVAVDICWFVLLRCSSQVMFVKVWSGNCFWNDFPISTHVHIAVQYGTKNIKLIKRARGNFRWWHSVISRMALGQWTFRINKCYILISNKIQWIWSFTAFHVIVAIPRWRIIDFHYYQLNWLMLGMHVSVVDEIDW